MKHIILALDGTWRAAYADPLHSNVYRMNLAFDYHDKHHNPQLFIYVAGVGTYGRASWLPGGSFGEGLDQLILGAYINLLSNYEPGDKIYMFGFSRGAVAARALTGMISYSGLLYPDQSALIDLAWRYFLDRESRIDFEGMKREATHDGVAIEFLGIWDTVYGRNSDKLIAKKKFNKLRLKNLALDQCVKSAVQILAIDETRNMYAPLFWTRRQQNQFCEQIWMPGVHTDVGGGYRNGLLSNISILSMISKLSERCPDISFDPDYIEEVIMTNIRMQPEIAINNEWKRYWAAPFDKRTRRAVPNDFLGLGHTVHPVARLLLDQNIVFKGSERSYVPTFSNSHKTIAEAQFDASVVDWKRVEDMITQKL
jgi:uncharacterized protein (DUF2235 family)